MTNWLDRARREMPKSSGKGTAVTDKIAISAVLAVRHLGKSGISSVNNGSIGSILTEGFQEIESMNMGVADMLPPVPAMTDAIHHQMEGKIPKSPKCGTAVTAEIDLTVAIMPPAVHQQPVANDSRLSYPERRSLYARQNALYLRLSRRLDKVTMTASGQAAEALVAWAGDAATADLYTGRRSWADQRRRIYAWARAELAAVRRHKELIVERAAIMEFDGGLRRVDAERKAGVRARDKSGGD